MRANGRVGLVCFDGDKAQWWLVGRTLKDSGAGTSPWTRRSSMTPMCVLPTRTILACRLAAIRPTEA
jgi:hypothetical protein